MDQTLKMTAAALGGRLLVAGVVLLWAILAPAAAWAEVTDPNGVAVIVGNRSYQHERVPEVSYADRDATAFRRYVTEVLGFDPLNVIDLNDATQADLESAFGNERNHEGQLWSYLDPEGGSDVVVFYSGHGVPGLNDGRGYLLPVDAHPDTADINGYPIDLLYANLGKLEEARSIAVYLDACFSGDSYRGMLVRSASPVFVSAELPETAGAKVTVLTAASGKEVASWDEEAEHGLFTNHLLDALYGKGDADRDGRVTAGEAASYLKRYMTRAARRLFRRHQNATLLGAAEAVLSTAVGGAFPARPVLGVVVAEPAPREAARTTVERDKYLLGMQRAHEAQDHGKVLEFWEKLAALGGEVPAVARYYRGVAYAGSGRYEEANEALHRYLEGAGKDGEHYRPALVLVLDLEETMAADDAAFDQATATGTASGYGAYLTKYPRGRHAAEARRRQKEAEAREDDAAFLRAQRADTSAAYAEYLREYPSGRHTAEARRHQADTLAREDDAAYERAQASDTAAAYAEYLRTYPAGRHSAEARRLHEQKDLSPGRVFRDCDECPEMVVVPAGRYLMGSPRSEARRDDDEGPQHRVTIEDPFAVGVYEVTFAEWDACARGGGCGHRPGDRGWGRGDRPVINVSWEDAQAYVRWLSHETGQEYRLPSESEWEYVARAGTTTPFHTGRTISTDQANYNGNSTYGAGRKGTYRERTVRVGSYAANGFGLYDVHGNVWEWTQDCWNDSYRGAPTDGRAWERGECGRRVVRGGSWDYLLPWGLRSAYRYWYVTGIRLNNLGFRVARTLTS